MRTCNRCANMTTLQLAYLGAGLVLSMKSSLRLNRIQRGLQFLARFGNQDFCPSLNRYVNWLKQPIGWFTSAGFVAFILGLFGEAEAFAVAGAIFGLVVLGIAWPAIAVRCVSAKLHWRKLRCEEGRV